MKPERVGKHEHWDGKRSEPVDDAAHVHLEVAEVSDEHLLHLDQIHQTLVQVDEAHAPLEIVGGVLASIICNWTSCG